MAACGDKEGDPRGQARHAAGRRRVSVVPHTHWDREWYSPFRTFQARLVELVDKLLDLMESDTSYACFLFDGQMAAVDDYLELRPENEGRLKRLGASGRISFGPWYILMDEFLVSGETIVRNLQAGIERAASFGGAMEIGYLPDMFGHIGQMPQLLVLTGLHDAVVWRGVPQAVSKTAFCWASPDGSTLRAEYLIEGYSVGAHIERDAKNLLRRIKAFAEEHREFFFDPDAAILFPNGSDHQEPQEWLGNVVAEANKAQDHFEIVICSLADALRAGPRSSLPTWRGELRSGARANLLMGVVSNRVDIKQAAARAEQGLERLAEPLAALFMAPADYPKTSLRVAWREMVRNSAHDSICACSHDEVAAAVLDRYAQATRIGEGITRRALGHLASSLAQGSFVAVNPSARTHSGVIELVVPGEDPIEGTQVLDEHAGLLGELVVTTDQLSAVLAQLGDSDEVGQGAYVDGVDIQENDSGIDISILIRPHRSKDLQIEQIKNELLASFALRPEVPVRVRVERVASRRVLARIQDVPGLGWKTWEPCALVDPVNVDVSDDGSVQMTNSLVDLTLSPKDGTFSLNGVAGFNRLIDSGDFGDTYNYSPPQHDQVVDTPEWTALSVLEAGPVRATAVVERLYHWPEMLDEQNHCRVGSQEILVRSRIELLAGEALVRITTSFENTCLDHRLRAWFPLSEPADHSSAECAFDIVDRTLWGEGGAGEKALATFPSRRFVTAGGLSVFHEGLLEYELVDLTEDTPHKARGLALTLLRCVGMLSRLTTTNRTLPAGPADPLEGPQMQGPQTLRYGVAIGVEEPYRLAEEAFLDLPVVTGSGGEHYGRQGQALSLSGAELSCLRRIGAGVLELRVFNPLETSSHVEVRDGMQGDGDAGTPGKPLSGQLVDLRGRHIANFEGSFDLGPHRIATAWITGR